MWFALFSGVIAIGKLHYFLNFGFLVGDRYLMWVFTFFLVWVIIFLSTCCGRSLACFVFGGMGELRCRRLMVGSNVQYVCTPSWSRAFLAGKTYFPAITESSRAYIMPLLKQLYDHLPLKGPVFGLSVILGAQTKLTLTSSPPGFCPRQEPWRFRRPNFGRRYCPWYHSSHASTFTDTLPWVHLYIHPFAVRSGHEICLRN